MATSQLTKRSRPHMWSSRYRSTRHTRISSQSQLNTSEHITKPPVVKFFICTPVR